MCICSSNGCNNNGVNKVTLQTQCVKKCEQIQQTQCRITCLKVYWEQYSSSDSRSSTVAWVTLGWVLWWSPLCLQKIFLIAEKILDSLTFTFFRKFTKIELQELSFVIVWSTTMMMNNAKAMPTEVYVTASWSCSVTVVYNVADAKTPRLRKNEYSMTFKCHVL